MKRLSTLVLSVTTLIAVSAFASPAHAEIRDHRDAAHDVRSIDFESESTESTPSPERREGDILGLRVNHDRNVVRVTLRYLQLHRGDELVSGHVLQLLTNEGKQAAAFTLVTPGDWQGTSLWGQSRGLPRRCPGLRTAIDYVHDSVQFAVPRRCLSYPRWVRVGAGSLTGDEAGLHADDSQRDDEILDELAMGAPVRHG